MSPPPMGSPPFGSGERPATRRYDLSLPIVVCVVPHKRSGPCHATIHDISASGSYFITNRAFTHAAKRAGTVLSHDVKHAEGTVELPPELVAHLRQNRTQLREEWVVRIPETRLLTAMTKEEIFAEATSIYDSYVEALETEAFEALQAYARNLSERIIPRGVETH